MSDDTSRRARQIFLEIASLDASALDRELRNRTAGDARLRDAVVSLLDARAAADDASFMSRPTATGITAPITESEGTVIGPFKLLQLIGEGGFGSVFLAEQSKPIRRRVAIKIIKLGMDTRQVIARFEAERQALALMEHPHIARVYDAGATETGRPYFAMEYVVGDAITRFADAHTLDIAARLDLFAQVCSAVQHAHTKGIIHRDLKPANVLVSMVDGRPFAKVIDFGIAKATASPLTDKTLFTEHRQLIGTPEYMSPEQAEGSPDIDTRTDVYALGVMLYELLTGNTPFDSARLRSAAWGEMQRIIREEDPPAPSLRLNQNLATLAATASARRVDPDRLRASVRGELDWVVMKALDKDRARRYDTPAQFASDIARHLTGEPVQAAPPSRAYKARKFVRRNKGAVVAGSAVAAALFVGFVGTTTGWIVAQHNANAANHNARLAQEQYAVSTRRANELQAVLHALDEMLLSVQSDAGASVTVKQMLDSHAARVRDLDVAFPAAAARVRETLSLAYLGLDAYAQSLEHARAAIDLLCHESADSLPTDAQRIECYAARLHALTVQSRYGTDFQERGRYAEGQPLLDAALSECDQLLAEVRADPPARILLPHILYRSGRMLAPVRVDDAIGAFREAANIAAQSDDTELPNVLAATRDGRDIESTARSRIGQSLAYAERYEEAETEYQRMLDFVGARYGLRSTEFARQASYNSWLYRQMDRPDLALGYADVSIRIGYAVFDPQSEELAKCHSTAANAAAALDRFADATWNRGRSLLIDLRNQGVENLYTRQGADRVAAYAAQAGIAADFHAAFAAIAEHRAQDAIAELSAALDARFGADRTRATEAPIPATGDASAGALTRWQNAVDEALRTSPSQNPEERRAPVIWAE